jgi:hypothetical protein
MGGICILQCSSLDLHLGGDHGGGNASTPKCSPSVAPPRLSAYPPKASPSQPLKRFLALALRTNELGAWEGHTGCEEATPDATNLDGELGARESRYKRGNRKENVREGEDWRASSLAKTNERERRNDDEFILAREEASLLETRFTFC